MNLQFSKLLKDWESLFMYMADPVPLQNPGINTKNKNKSYKAYYFFTLLIPYNEQPELIPCIGESLQIRFWETEAGLQASHRNSGKSQNLKSKNFGMDWIM